MRERDDQGVWDGHVPTAIFKTDNQQGPTVSVPTRAHGTLLSIMWQPGWEGTLEDIFIRVAGSPCCLPEMITMFVNWLYPSTK